MKIAVIGAGIVGVSTAYELAVEGHEVLVFERHAAVAEEASFAHTGLLSPDHLLPWHSRSLSEQIARPFFGAVPAIRWRWPWHWPEAQWLWRARSSHRWDLSSTVQRHWRELAHYSVQRLAQISAQHQLEYENSSGCLVVFRQEKDWRQAQAQVQALKTAGAKLQEIGKEEALHKEPALNRDTALFKAVYLPQSGAANSRQFALLLRQEAQKLGARFEFGRAIELQAQAPLVLQDIATGANTQGSMSKEAFDAVVVCAGSGAEALLQRLGLQLPMMSLSGYSLSAQLREPLDAPRSALVDERHQVSITRMGQRVRVAGGFELSGRPQQRYASSLHTLYQALQDWFPGAAQHRSVQEWKGVVTLLPDAAPILGLSGIPGLWLNIGHGHQGWTTACGTARVLADQIAGRQPAVDVQSLGIQRWL